VGSPLAPRATLRALDGGKGRLPTVRDVAGLLGVSPATVYRLCEEVQLPHVRSGNAIRVHPDDVPGSGRSPT
jgi:excisionase family DNA binding protein